MNEGCSSSRARRDEGQRNEFSIPRLTVVCSLNVVNGKNCSPRSFDDDARRNLETLALGKSFIFATNELATRHGTSKWWDERWANIFHVCFSGNKTLSFVHNSNNYSFGNDHRCRVDWPPDARTTRTSYKYNSVIPWCVQCTSTAIRWQWPLRPCCFVFAPDWQTHESNLIFDYLSIVKWQGCLEVTWAITWAISHLRCMATVWLRTDEHITGSDGRGWMFSGNRNNAFWRENEYFRLLSVFRSKSKIRLTSISFRFILRFGRFRRTCTIGAQFRHRLWSARPSTQAATISCIRKFTANGINQT